MQKKIYWALKLGLTFLLLVVIFRQIPPADLRSVYEQSDWRGILLTIALAIPNLLIQIFRWGYLVRIVKPSVPGRQIIASLFSGFSIGIVTPGRIGELGRGLFIPDAPRAELTGMVLIEKMVSLWALSILGVSGFIYLRLHDRTFSELVTDVFLALGIVLVIGLVIIVVDANLMRRWVRRSAIVVDKLPFREKLLALVAASELFKKAHLPMTFFFSIVFQMVILTQIVSLLNAFDHTTILAGLAAGSAAMLVKSMLPFTVMDLGIREGALILFLGSIGIPPAAALNASLVLFIINVLVPSSIGYALIARRKFGAGP